MLHTHPWIAGALLALALRPLVVLIHVWAHAWIAAYYSNEKISVFIGSHGDQDRSASVSVGRFEIWFTVNPLLWQTGLCVHDDTGWRINAKILYVLIGPIVPILVAVTTWIIASSLSWSEGWVFTTQMFVAVAVADVCVNLIPIERPLALVERKLFYNDGYTLKLLLTQKKYPPEFFVGIHRFERHEYLAAANYFEKAARLMPQRKNIARNLLASYTHAIVACRRLNDHIAASIYYSKAKELTTSHQLDQMIENLELRIKN